MRILHLTALYPPHIVGGAERSVEHLAEELAAMGHEVGAACIEREGHPREVRNDVTVYRMPHSNDFWLEDWPQHGRLSRAWQKMKQQWNFEIERHFDRVLEDFKPDVLNTHSLLDVSTLVWRAASKRGIPIVHTVCEYDLICANAAMFKNGKPCDHWHVNCQAISFTKRLNTKMTSAATFVGKAIRQTHVDHGYFTHLPEERRRVIYYSSTVVGGDPERRRAIDRTGKPMSFGYLGRINTEKGVGTIIDALREMGPGDWTCKIAGQAMDDSIERFTAQSEGLPIEFVGWVDPKTFFDEIDVLIVPSIWAEPSPRTIYEAYAVGVPCIGARTGGIPELIGEDNNDWLFAGGDHKELATRIRNVMAKGRESFPPQSEFQWVLDESTSRRVAEKFEALYKEVLEAPRAG